MIERIWLLFSQYAHSVNEMKLVGTSIFKLLVFIFPPKSGSYGPTRHYEVKRNLHVNSEKINI